MPLDWDVLLDDVSIKTQIAGFQVRESKGAYARELTLFAADPDFYDQFDYTTIPLLRIEVKTKIATTLISQGKFYVERPGIFANPDSILSPGVWGRSETARAGPPFAAKVSKTWDKDTTCQAIITEMADLCGLSVTFEIDDYTIFANSYAADGVYPIDVISELADFAGAHVGCTPAGALVIKQEIFHPAAADYTITDDDISDLAEQLEYPEFGNRIRISAFGAGAGNSVTLTALNNNDCLPSDGASTGTLLAFVTDADGNAVPDNTIVTWTIEDGATLASAYTNTGNYLLQNRKHRATNYQTVEVDFPIAEVIGVWAYADAGGQNNYWDEDYGSFDGKTITVSPGFAFCDQSLRIAYITGGCAINTVTAGSTALDVDVTADVEGASDTIEIKLGNTCACGSNLNAKINPVDSICLGNLAQILIWATISNIPATGQKVEVRLTKGCGELSSENKILKNVSIKDEASHVQNVIAGVSQVSVDIDISGAQLPSVYEKTDTGKSNNLYSSYAGKVIDLDIVLETGAEVVVDYYADGATAISWRTLGATKDCDAEVTVSMADGTEAGLYDTISLRAIDCTIATTPPDDNEDYSDYDPVFIGYGGNSGGFEDDGNSENTEPEEGTGPVDPCFVTIMNRILNIDNATNDEERDAIRFGTKSSADCPDDGNFDCSCSELCTSEVMSEGNIMSEELTIHEIVSETYEKGTPEYNEEFASVMADNIASCSEDCEANRLLTCGGCDTATGPESLAPGDSAEYICSDGTSEIITMPEGHCGAFIATMGCCTVKIRSTIGRWVTVDYEHHIGIIVDCYPDNATRIGYITFACGPPGCTVCESEMIGWERGTVPCSDEPCPLLCCYHLYTYTKEWQC